MKDIDGQVIDVEQMTMKKYMVLADIHLEKDWLHERKNNSMTDKSKIVHMKHYIVVEHFEDEKDKQIQYVENKIVDVFYQLELLDKERKW